MQPASVQLIYPQSSTQKMLIDYDWPFRASLFQNLPCVLFRFHLCKHQRSAREEQCGGVGCSGLPSWLFPSSESGITAARQNARCTFAGWGTIPTFLKDLFSRFS
jgi:hypothetical protein